MSNDLILFHLCKGVCAAFIAVICTCRAARMDGRCRAFPMWTFVLLAMSSAGLGISPILDKWLIYVCFILFMVSVCFLLIEGQARWDKGLPDEMLKKEYRWPFKERREGERRGGGRRS